MSCFRLCDGDDCENTENEGLFSVTYNVKKFLESNYPYWEYYNNAQDLCQNCIDNINEGYPEEEPLLVFDPRFKYSPDLKINDLYIDNPELLKETDD